MLPYLPYRSYLHLKNAKAMKNRFFPLDYIKAGRCHIVLKPNSSVLLLDEPVEIQESTSAEEITAYFKDRHGIVYDDYIDRAIGKKLFIAFSHRTERLEFLQERIANWNANDFNYLAFDGGKKIYSIDIEKDMAVPIQVEELPFDVWAKKK